MKLPAILALLLLASPALADDMPMHVDPGIMLCPGDPRCPEDHIRTQPFNRPTPAQDLLGVQAPSIKAITGKPPDCHDGDVIEWHPTKSTGWTSGAFLRCAPHDWVFTAKIVGTYAAAVSWDDLTARECELVKGIATISGPLALTDPACNQRSKP